MKIKFGIFNLFQFVEPPYSWYTKKEKFNTRQWLEKTAWIKSQIRLMDCDIIGFQEVFSRDALEILVKELGYDYFETSDVAKLSMNNPKKYVTTTVAIASKYPIIAMQNVKTHTPSIQKHHFSGHFNFSRVPIKASIMFPNKEEVLVYVCHLKSNRLNAFEYVFKEEDTLEHKKELVFASLKDAHSDALRQRLCEASSLFFDIKKSKQPTVLLCDLNDKTFSLTLEALSNNKYHEEKKKENLLLHDAYYQCKEEMYNPHPEAKVKKRKATSYFLGQGNVLDYIFISNHFDTDNKEAKAYVSKYTVLDAHLKDNKDGSLLTSDHAQVVCELTFSSHSFE